MDNMTDRMLRFIQHPLVLFFLAWLISYLFYRLQKHFRRLSYQSQETVVIDAKASKNEDGLEVRYGGEVVPQVTRTTIRFWNSGTEAIRGGDISDVDPLRLQFPEGAQILSLTFLKATRDPIDVKVMQEGNQARVSFAFLEPGDGAVFSVLHSGASGKSKLKGTVIGLKDHIAWWGGFSDAEQIFLLPGSGPKGGGKWAFRFFFFLACAATIFGALSIISGIYPNFFLDHFPQWFNEESSSTDLVRDKTNFMRIVLGAVIVGFFGAVAAAVIYGWRTRPPVSLR